MIFMSDAVVGLPDGGLLRFAGNELWRYDGRGRLRTGYPRRIVDDFPGAFPHSIDAGVVGPDGSLTLFRRDQHLRYDVAARRRYPGFPRSYGPDWPGVPARGVNAAVMWAPDVVYLFTGNTYSSFSPARRVVRPGYPKPIAGNWPVGGPVRAAIVLPSGRRLLATQDRVVLVDHDGRLLDREVSGELTSMEAPAAPFRSRRFQLSPARSELEAVAGGRARLGRPGDPNVPAPIVSQGPAVREVQQALVDLGFALPRLGVDGKFGDETYAAALAYKRAHNIRTDQGYLDGIVGPRTIAHLDEALARLEPPTPCPSPLPGPITARTSGELLAPTLPPIPGVTCSATPVPVVIVPGIMGTRLVEPATGRGVWDPTGRFPQDFAVDFGRLHDPSGLAPNETGTSLPGRKPLPPELAAVRHFNNLVYEAYGPLIEQLVRPPFAPAAAAAGGRPVYVAGYDWRDSAVTTSRRVGQVVEQALRETGASEVIIVAHSMGGLVSRYFLHGTVHLPSGAVVKAPDVVRQLVLLASPSHGAPMAYRQLKVGLQSRDGKLFQAFRYFSPIGLSSRDMLRGFQSVYELLPHQAWCTRFPSWLRFDTKAAGIADASVADTVYANHHVGFLERPDPIMGTRLRLRSSVDKALDCFFPAPTTIIFASHLQTETSYELQSGVFGFSIIVHTGPGDQTVPEMSGRADACTGGTGGSITRIAIPAVHGAYPVDPAVIKEVQRIILTAPARPAPERLPVRTAEALGTVSRLGTTATLTPVGADESPAMMSPV